MWWTGVEWCGAEEWCREGWGGVGWCGMGSGCVDLLMLLCIVLYCAIRLYFIKLYCTALHFAVLHCITMHCIALQYTSLHCTVLYCTVLHCTVLHCTILYCTTLHFTVLYCTALYCIALHSTVLYCTVLYCIVFTLHCIQGPRSYFEIGEGEGGWKHFFSITLYNFPKNGGGGGWSPPSHPLPFAEPRIELYYTILYCTVPSVVTMYCIVFDCIESCHSLPSCSLLLGLGGCVWQCIIVIVLYCISFLKCEKCVIKNHIIIVLVSVAGKWIDKTNDSHKYIAFEKETKLLTRSVRRHVEGCYGYVANRIYVFLPCEELYSPQTDCEYGCDYKCQRYPGENLYKIKES